MINSTKYILVKYHLVLLYILVQFLSATEVQAQTSVIVRGTVSDSIDNSRIIGATVTEYDKDRRVILGTITDINGNFTITLKDRNDIIAVSFVGYNTKEIRLKPGETNLDVKLRPRVAEIAGINVVAKFIAIDPITGVSFRDRTGSVAKLDLTESSNLGMVSAEEALQGAASGVDIMSSGGPGGGSQITIRGLSSLGGSSPLIVVDGIEQNISIDDDFSFSSADQDDIGDLVGISPQDIATIEVLKDGSTAALWGSKGADGVLLITTKRGTRGKTKFEYQGKYTMSIEPPSIPMLSGDEYIMMQLEELQNQNGLFDLPSEIAYDPNYVDFNNYNKNTNWIDAVTQMGFIKDNSFNISGGGDKTTYRVSLNYLDEEGTTKNTGVKRIDTRINLDYRISTKLNFRINFNYSNVLKEDNYRLGKNVREMAFIKAPNMSIYEYDQNNIPTGEYFTPITSYQGNGYVYYNPVAMVDLSLNDQNQHTSQNSFIINNIFLKWLRSSSTLSFQYLNRTTNQFLPSAAIGIDWLNSLNNRASENNALTTKITFREQLFITPQFKNPDHKLLGNLLFEIESSDAESVTLWSSNGSGYGIQDPAATSHMHSISSSLSQSRGIGALSGFNYKYKDRYLLSFNTRLDGSSKFGANNRWGFFPSISGGWRFTEERFFKRMKFLSNGKLSASWAQAGKQPRSVYGRHSYFNSPNPNQYIDNQIIVPTQLQLENLKWQTVTSWNIGLETSFLNDKFSVSYELYSKLTEDMLWDDYDIPTSSGYSVLNSFNGGSVQNKGWDLTFNVNAIKVSDFSLNFDFIISHNQNSFLEFPDNISLTNSTEINNGVFPTRADVGKPVGSFYGFKYLGVWASDEDVVALDAKGNPLVDVNNNPIPLTYKNEYTFQGGDAKYADINHDGNIDLLDAVYLGDSNPDFFGGFGANIRWKNFRLSSRFVYRTGFQIVNQIALITEGMNDRNNQSKAVLHRWRVQGQDEEGMIPRAYMNHVANNLGSDRYVEDGDYLRLNYLTLSHDVDKKICKRLGVNALSFGLTARRLFTITNYSGQDPEIPQSGTNPFWFGVDNGKTPTPRSYVFNIGVRF